VRRISRLLSVTLLIVAAPTWGQDYCTVSTVSVQFGQYNVIDVSPVDAVGSVRIACPPGTGFTVKLDPGEDSGSSFHPRRMHSTMSSGTLDYNLYRDPTRTEVLGDGTNNTFVHLGAATGAVEVVNVYGRLLGRQNVGAGLYRDSIVVTVEW
jgi:spore coat protein U domain-containing protein, fimbrial subunit CupE1/2/3/6